MEWWWRGLKYGVTNGDRRNGSKTLKVDGMTVGHSTFPKKDMLGLDMIPSVTFSGSSV